MLGTKKPKGWDDLAREYATAARHATTLESEPLALSPKGAVRAVYLATGVRPEQAAALRERLAEPGLADLGQRRKRLVKAIGGKEFIVHAKMRPDRIASYVAPSGDVLVREVLASAGATPLTLFVVAVEDAAQEHAEAFGRLDDPQEHIGAIEDTKREREALLDQLEAQWQTAAAVVFFDGAGQAVAEKGLRERLAAWALR